MIDVLLALIIASSVGSVIWIIQNSIRPLTQKLFSQTWHYYTTLIPVFFLVGGTEIMVRVIPLIRSILNKSVTTLSGSIPQKISPVPLMEDTTASSSPFLQTLVGSLRALGYKNDLVLLILVIWMAGIVVFLTVNLKNYWVFKRSILQHSQVADINVKPVKVFVSPLAMTPMVIGFLNPVIVMPDTRFEQKELAMILSHELIHLKRRDLLVKFIVLLANSIHWFNPVVYSLSKKINIYCELSCDEKVVQEMDEESRRFYGETLLSMLEYGVMRRNLIGVNSLYHSKEDMKRRLGNLMNVKKTKKSMVMLSVVASTILVGSGGIAADYADAAANTSSKYMIEGGSNITVKRADGTTISYDKDGNIIPEPPRTAPRELTADEMVERIELHLGKGLPVPEAYVVQLKKLGKTDELTKIFDGLTYIKLYIQGGVATFSVADLLKP